MNFVVIGVIWSTADDALYLVEIPSKIFFRSFDRSIDRSDLIT